MVRSVKYSGCNLYGMTNCRNKEYNRMRGGLEIGPVDNQLHVIHPPGRDVYIM